VLANELGVAQSVISRVENSKLPVNIPLLCALEEHLSELGVIRRPFLIRDWL